jgi:tetratricopeptide (TPR) repeat protein
VTFFREQGDTWNLARSLNSLGLVIRDQENYDLAWSTIEKSAVLWRQQGDMWGLAQSLHFLGLVAYRRGDYSEACAKMGEALEIRRRLEDKRSIAYSLHNLGVFTLAQGDLEHARLYFDQDLIMFRQLGDKSGVVIALQYQGLFAHLQGDDDQAMQIYRQGLILSRQTGPNWIYSNYLLWLADLSAKSSQYDRAVRLCSAARVNLTASASYWDQYESGYYARIMARARTELGDEAFMQEQAIGQAMTLDQAIEYALVD